MGVAISRMFSEHRSIVLDKINLGKHTVLSLSEYCLDRVFDEKMEYSHLLVATSCPDSIAPSLGQSLNQCFHPLLSNTHTIDLVQGCAGGVSALILASHLAEFNRSNVLVVTADAARKASSPSSPVYKAFNNGVFASCISFSDNNKRLIHSKSKQYKDLHNVVKIGLGHDADEIISENLEEILTDSRKHLGLLLNNHLAIKLMKEAESFYLNFISECGHPDILILHQVNEQIINHLEQVFSKYPLRFINIAKMTGNCGCATTGIVLDIIKSEIQNKKVMICSFGTGGLITAGLWQF